MNIFIFFLIWCRSGIAVGGVAVRITADAWSSGNVRLKHSTAEQFLGPEILQDSRGESGDDPNGPKSLFLHPCPAAEGSASLVHAQLRIVPTTARPSQALDDSPPPPPSLHCELCGLGAWLRGQGAVPGVHWVQLWRGAGGALRLRLCDGKPTALPGEEATGVQQMETGGTEPNAAARSLVVQLPPAGAAVAPTEPTSTTPGACDAAVAASVQAAAADAAAKLVGPAAQAAADAAAPWHIHAPTCRVPCMPAGAALQGCRLGAAGVVPADGVGSAARCAPNGDHIGPLPTTQLKAGSGGGSGPVTPGVAGRDSRGADCRGWLDAAPPHPRRGGNTGSAGHSRSLSPLPTPPPPMLPAVPTLPPPSPLLSPPPSPPVSPAQQAPRPMSPAGAPAVVDASATPRLHTAAAFGSAAAAAEAAAAPAAASREYTVRITAEGGRHVGWLKSEALALWPDACQLQFGQAAAVTLHPRDQPGTLPYKTTVGLRLSAKLVRHDASTFALSGLGQAGDVLILWRDRTGTVWVGLSQVHSGTGQDLQQLGQQQGQGQDGGLQQEQEQGQEQQQGQGGGGPVALRRPLSTSILTGNVGRTKIRLRTDEVDGVLAPSLSQGHPRQLKPCSITVHVEGGAAGGSSGDGGAEQGQQQESQLTVRLRCFQPAASCQPKWYLSSVHALLKALGAQDGDTVQLQRMSDGRLVIWRAARHLYRRHKQLLPAAAVPLAACPPDSILVGVINSNRVPARVGAVRALWPEVARRLTCGQSTEVEVYPSAADAGTGPCCPFRVTLKLWMYQSPTWQLTGCRALFRALGAQTRDALCMWRSPGDGRLMAGVQPRGGSRRPGEELPQGQEQEQEQQPQGRQGREEEQQPPEQQGQEGGEDRRLRQERARQGAVLRKYGEYAMQEESDGEEGGQAEEEEEEQEECRSGDGEGEGPPGLLDDGLSRPSKRARAAEEVAQQYGGPSAAQQQRMQLTTCPTGSILVGHKYRTLLQPRVTTVRALWPDLASQLVCGQSTEVEVHAAVEGAGGEVLEPFRVMLRLQTRKGTSPLWRLTHCGPLFRALGAQERDAVFMWRLPVGGRLMAGLQPRVGVPWDKDARQQPGQEATQQQQVQGQRQRVHRLACPAGSVLVGRKQGTQLEVLMAAVKALWPDLACRWVCGQSMVVEVYPAVADAGGGALGPFRVVLKLESWPSKPLAWRLTGCGALFRALVAQERDVIHMWRSPGDGRLMAGVQPRGGARGGGKPRGEVQGGGKGVQVGQRGAGLGRARGRVRQMCDKHESTDEEDVWPGEDEENDGEEGEAAREVGEGESSEALGYRMVGRQVLGHCRWGRGGRGRVAAS